LAWRSKIPQQLVSVDGEDTDGIDDLEQPDVKLQIHQKRCAPRSAVPDEKTLSVDTLPAWAKLLWKSQFIPSLIDILGRESNPWDIEKWQDDSFIDTLQQIVDGIYPEASYTVQKNCKVFCMVSQKAYQVKQH